MMTMVHTIVSLTLLLLQTQIKEIENNFFIISNNKAVGGIVRELNFVFALHIFFVLCVCSMLCVVVHTSCEYKVTTSNAITHAYMITILWLLFIFHY